MSQKKLTLQEQLLKSGLTSEAKVKQIRSDKLKQEKQVKHNKAQLVNEVQQLAEQTKQQQLLRDKELNLQAKSTLEQKAVIAQIRQLIDLNKIPIIDQNIAYHFNDQNKVKTLYLSENQRNAISKGLYAIVKIDETYSIVASEVAQKIKARGSEYIIVLIEQDQAINKDDEYSAYEIPDDLIW